MLEPLSPPTYKELSPHITSFDQFFTEPLPREPLDRIMFLRDYMLVKVAAFRARLEVSNGDEVLAQALALIEERNAIVQRNVQAVNFVRGKNHELDRHAKLLAAQMDVLFADEYDELLALHPGTHRHIYRSMEEIWSIDLPENQALILNLAAISHLAAPRSRSGFILPEHAKQLFAQMCYLYSGSFEPEYYEEMYGPVVLPDRYVTPVQAPIPV